MSEGSAGPFFQQMKLTNGEEIIAEVEVWDEHDVIVKNVLKITTNIFETLNEENGDPYNYYHYGLKPWMAYSIHSDGNISMSESNIVGTCYPSEMLLGEYAVALASIKKFNEEMLESYRDYKEQEKSEPEKTAKKTSSNVFRLFRGDDDDTVH